MKETQPTEDVKRWTAKRKAALVMDLIKGKTTIAKASREFDLAPSELEGWIDEATRGMENALRAKPRDIKAQYDVEIKNLQAKVGELVLELDARKKLQALLEFEENSY